MKLLLESISLKVKEIFENGSMTDAGGLATDVDEWLMADVGSAGGARDSEDRGGAVVVVEEKEREEEEEEEVGEKVGRCGPSHYLRRGHGLGTHLVHQSVHPSGMFSTLSPLVAPRCNPTLPSRTQTPIASPTTSLSVQTSPSPRRAMPPGGVPRGEVLWGEALLSHGAVGLSTG